MSKKIEFPQAAHDFYKSNGVDAKTYNYEPSMARQEFAEECDINQLMKRYETYAGTGPGNLPLSNNDPSKMFYADFTALPMNLIDYHQYMAEAEHAFMTLPAVVRREFENSPYLFVEFASDPANLEQMRTWGLAPAAPKEPPPQKVEIVNPPAESAPAGSK